MINLFYKNSQYAGLTPNYFFSPQDHETLPDVLRLTRKFLQLQLPHQIKKYSSI